MAEVEFREGKREIPDHLADMMTGLDTYKMTYDEAVAEANKAMEKRLLRQAENDVLRAHFRGVVR